MFLDVPSNAYSSTLWTSRLELEKERRAYGNTECLEVVVRLKNQLQKQWTKEDWSYREELPRKDSEDIKIQHPSSSWLWTRAMKSWERPRWAGEQVPRSEWERLPPGNKRVSHRFPGREMMMMRQKVRPVYGFWVPIKKRKVRVFPVEHFVLKYGAVDRFNRS